MPAPLTTLYGAAVHIATGLVQGRSFTATNHDEIAETSVALALAISLQVDAQGKLRDEAEEDDEESPTSPFYDMLIDRVTERVLEKMHMKEPS